MAALSYVPFAGAYTVSKHAVLGFTEQLALDLRALDVPIGVTALCPSGTRGNMQANSAVLRPSSLPPSVETNTKREYLKAVTSTVNHALTDPDDVGRLVIDAVRDDTLYVLTHESAPERIQVRFDCILSGAQPPVTTAPPRLGRSGSR
jgi:NAD(P)-dependent dehydrogenase (short-subunit alcohol dehydrogenase family)